MVLRITRVSISAICRFRTFNRSASAEGLPLGPARFFADSPDERDLSGFSVRHEKPVCSLAGNRLPMRVAHLQPHTVLGKLHVSGERELFRIVRNGGIKIFVDEAFQTRWSQAPNRLEPSRYGRW